MSKGVTPEDPEDYEKRKAKERCLILAVAIIICTVSVLLYLVGG